ncbi:MAG: hypothetical protein ACD_72C00449G0001 [uncultured bacterium]|nr:MAG: hypothetical protein ACD_72C00449G0001 [uncultured bacterium]
MGEKGVRHIPEAVRKGEAFLSGEQLADYANTWKEAATESESSANPDNIYGYPANRVDTPESGFEITELHDEDFIKETIPSLIASNPNRKVKILDVGGGSARFAQQIRDAFGDKVEVFTTGLSKGAAKLERKTKLHKNDLKWRSVLQLTDFPEFDLIVDTFGEYGNINDQLVYLSAVSSKLIAGGHASVVGFNFAIDDTGEPVEISEIEKNKQVEITQMVTFSSKPYNKVTYKIDKPLEQVEQK